MKTRTGQHTLQKHRARLISAWGENLQHLPKWRSLWRNPHERDDFLRLDVAPFVDYLERFLQSGREEYFWLYFGEKHRQVYESGIPKDRLNEFLYQVISDDLADCRHLAAPVFQTMADRVNEFFSRMLTLLRQPIVSRLCVLFIGDCLYTDVLDFLVPMCLSAGITLDYDRITTKNPVDQQRCVKRVLSEKEYDLIAYSPFSYAACREYELLLSPRQAWAGRSRWEPHIEHLAARTTGMMHAVAQLSEAPLFVHLMSGIRRQECALWRHRLIKILTGPIVADARRRLNEIMARCADAINTDSFERVFLVDEREWAARDGWRPHELEECLYHGPRLHTARLGTALAKEYFAACFVAGFLRTKKVIVTDCDNTLWEGVIGEGAVRPYVRRQRILKELKQRGLLLAVNSKNNPHDVRWDGQCLKEEDFVAAAVNWAPKTDNMKTIAKELNLKVKDFVFLDDSRWERELMKAKRPEVLTMDADDPLTWWILENWISWRPKESRSRTQLYHEEKRRKGVLLHAPVSGMTSVEALKGLRMRVVVRRAERSDLKRIMELINRTNQFNLCGTRVRYRELETWLADPTKRLIAAELKDRFGDFGIVCAALIEGRAFDKARSPQGTTVVRIPVFVMSCRVIGYGVDTAVINAIKKAVFTHPSGDSTAEGVRLVGCFRPTAHNQPCADLYEANGFSADRGTGAWICFRPAPKDIPWLEVDDRHFVVTGDGLAGVLFDEEEGVLRRR